MHVHQLQLWLAMSMATASALVLKGYNDTEVVEAMACREGLALASGLGLHSFRVASNCANAVRSFTSKGHSRYGPIVQEINDRRQSSTSAEFFLEGRRSNDDAHLVARSSVILSIGRHVWFLSLLMEFVILIAD